MVSLHRSRDITTIFASWETHLVDSFLEIARRSHEMTDIQVACEQTFLFLSHPWEAIFTKAVGRRLPVGGGEKSGKQLGSPHRFMHGLRNESRTGPTQWWSLRHPEWPPPSPASPAHWPTEGNWGFLVQWFKSGSNLYSSRWLIHCVGSASLTWFTWIRLIFYILPFFFQSKSCVGWFSSWIQPRAGWPAEASFFSYWIWRVVGPGGFWIPFRLKVLCFYISFQALLQFHRNNKSERC